MSKRDRFRLATEARQRKAASRAARLRAMVAAGAMVKQAAYAAGVSQRTASRYLGRVA